MEICGFQNHLKFISYRLKLFLQILQEDVRLEKEFKAIERSGRLCTIKVSKLSMTYSCL